MQRDMQLMQFASYTSEVLLKLMLVVDLPQMQSILLTSDTVTQKAQALLDAALTGGGEDNITVLLLSLGGR